MLALALLLQAAASPVADPVGDAVRGERQFQRCFACDSVDPLETANLQGPSLYGVVGRKAGAIAGFDYSEALRRRAGDGLMWSDETLNQLMRDPERYIPGIRMSMPGLAEAQDRADIIAYLLDAGRRTP